MLPKPCLTCGRPSRNGNRCPTCQAQATTRYEQRHRQDRGSSTQQGYGSDHRKRAAALRAQCLPCALCGQPVDYTLRSPHPWSFSAHHLTPDRAGPIVTAHRRCNEQAGPPRW